MTLQGCNLALHKCNLRLKVANASIARCFIAKRTWDVGKARMGTADIITFTISWSNTFNEYELGVDLGGSGVEFYYVVAFNDGDPLIVQSTGGVTQMIPKKQIKGRRDLGRSLMYAPETLGLSAQDVADMVTFLKTYE